MRRQDHARYVARGNYICSGHILINSERQKRSLPVLRRSQSLDRVARHHALLMAQNCKVSPVAQTNEDLQAKLMRKSMSSKGCINCTRVAQNVGHGFSVKRIHHVEMTNKLQTQYADNVLSKQFTHVGFGSTRGDDGKIYMVQLFRGRQDARAFDRVRQMFGRRD